ncbi:hypothetical protein [Bradyrhizobium genosp. A]|uniref:hypothetical protein n=1 Tax=Bradyrhizobium genosp. A TaxID=83626 RepID=UPI003CEE1CE7
MAETNGSTILTGNHTVLEISFLLLEERQQLLENLIPMPVDFPVECVTKARRMGMDRFAVC